MNTLQTAAQQALGILDSEFTTVDGEFCRWCDGRLNAKHNCALEQTITALKAALAEPETCTWQQDGDSDSGVYGTSCRRYFNLEDGTPEDNKMKWCCYCGKNLAQALITEDEDD